LAWSGQSAGVSPRRGGCISERSRDLRAAWCLHSGHRL